VVVLVALLRVLLFCFEEIEGMRKASLVSLKASAVEGFRSGDSIS
jgi:hypothetical protein